MSSSLDVSLAFQSPNKCKDRNSCSTSFSDESNEIEDGMRNLEFEFQNSNCLRNTRFQPEIMQPEITAKLLKKAVHVLLSMCWDKDIAQDTVWTAVMIFYSYKSKCIIKKIDLQKILSVSVLLSCKLLQPEKLCLKDIMQITNGKYSLKQIFQTQEEILSALDFDIYLENSISTLKSVLRLDEVESQQFNCLAEMLMLKGSQAFWKRSILSSLVKIIRGFPYENSIELAGQLVELCKSKEGEFILRKYSSVLDTEKLLQKLQMY